MDKIIQKAIQSSSDPKKTSMTVKGILLSLAPIAIAIMSSQGVEGAESVYGQLVETVTAFISASLIAFGASRKLYNEIKTLLN